MHDTIKTPTDWRQTSWLFTKCGGYDSGLTQDKSRQWSEWNLNPEHPHANPAPWPLNHAASNDDEGDYDNDNYFYANDNNDGDDEDDDANDEAGDDVHNDNLDHNNNDSSVAGGIYGDDDDKDC